MNAIQGARALRYGGPPRECPRNISPISILVSTSPATTTLLIALISLFVLLQRWNCVVDWSRRLPTLTICKRSSLWCVDWSHIALVKPAARQLFSGRNAWSQITFFVRLNLSTYLLSKVRSLQMRIGKFPFKPELFNIESQIGRRRLELARLS